MGRMDKDKIKKNNKVIQDYCEGKVKLKGEHPEDVEKAIDTFFHAGKMLIDYPEMDRLPSEYIEQLIGTMAQYPRYHKLIQELLLILKKHR